MRKAIRGPLFMRLRHCMVVLVVVVAVAAVVFEACASHRDDAGEKSATTASAFTWAQQQNLVPSDTMGVLFGRQLAATPTFVAVGDYQSKAHAVAHDRKQTVKLVPPVDGNT